jgi:hypothetical protein
MDVRSAPRTRAVRPRIAGLAAALLPFATLSAGAAGTGAANAAARDGADTAAKVAAAADGRRPEARIAFADHGGIWNWQAVDRDTLLIEGRDRRWYRAELMGPCTDLPFAQAIGFQSNPTGDFDKFSAVIVRGQRCSLRSLTETAPPATARGRHPPKPASATAPLPPPQ